MRFWVKGVFLTESTENIPSQSKRNKIRTFNNKLNKNFQKQTKTSQEPS